MVSGRLDNASKEAFAPLFAGISAGGVSTALLLPLDNIKVRLQVNEGIGSGSESNSKVRNRVGSSFRLMRGVIHHEGFRGLYQGLVPAVVGSSVSWGGFFFVYETFKRKLRAMKGSSATGPYELTSLDNFQLACASGVVMVGLTNPIWLIKLRMQLQMKKASEQLQSGSKPYSGMVDAARTIVREEGPWALYKGAGPALLLTSHGGVQFVVYEFLRRHFHYSRAKREAESETSSVIQRLERSMGYLTIGAISKIAASTTTYPLQVMKARMQQRSQFVELTSDGDVRVVKRDYVGLIGTARRIWAKEGFQGFFKGCIPNAFRVAPSAAVTFVVYESVLDFAEHL